MSRIYLLLISWMAFSCGSSSEETIISLNDIKSDALEEQISISLEMLDKRIEYYDHPPTYMELRANLFKGLNYLDSVTANPRTFNLDSLLKRTKRSSNFIEEQASIINHLQKAASSNLIDSSLDLELKKLKGLLIQDALYEFDLYTFKADEPIILIDTDKNSYKRGERVRGTVRLVLGSSNIKSSISSFKVNERQIKIDEKGEGIVDMPFSEQLDIEVNMHYPFQGNYTFRDKKRLSIEN